jgi:hypothetical protein
VADLDVTSSLYLFKLLAEQKLDDGALKRNNPLTAWMHTETDFTSARGKEVPIEYTTAQGAGGTFAIAASTANPSAAVKFLVPQRMFIMNAGITYQVLQNAANGGSDSEFADALVNEMDGVTQQFGNHIERQAWGTDAGIRGVVATGTASPITLTNKTDAQLLEVGQSIEAISSGGTLRSGVAVISKINRSTGTITYTGTITSLAVGDSIVGQGDGGNFASPVRSLSCDGVQAFCPVTPSASFLGVDQTTDRERVAGIYYDGSTQNISNAFIGAQAVSDLMSGLGLDSAAPIFVNPLNYAQIAMSAQSSKIIAQGFSDTYGIGLKGITIGDMNFVKAAFCPVNQAFKIGKGAFTRGTAGTQPSLNKYNADGSAFTFDTATGLLKFTMGHLGNTYSKRPYHIMRVALSPQGIL